MSDKDERSGPEHLRRVTAAARSFANGEKAEGRRGRVATGRTEAGSPGEDPLVTFTEWAGEADERAYRDM